MTWCQTTWSRNRCAANHESIEPYVLAMRLATLSRLRAARGSVGGRTPRASTFGRINRAQVRRRLEPV